MKHLTCIIGFLLCLLFTQTACKFLTEMGGGYTKEEGTVYWSHGLGGSSHLVVKDADYKSFKGLNMNYGKDKAHVFYRTDILEGADLKTFEIFNDVSYAKDKSVVYYDGEVIPGADVATYHLFPVVGVDNTHYNTYGMDKDHVFQFREIISDDPEHFKVINPNEHIWKDGMAVHWAGTVIDSADAPTFEAILFKEQSEEFRRYSSYYKDKDHVFVKVKDKGVIVEIIHLPKADVASFRLISENFSQDEYAADETHVYYENKLVEGADPATFVLMTDGTAKDKNKIYKYGKPAE